MDDSEEKEYDVVLDALKIHRDKLWKMTNSHNGIMDTLRMEQIAKLDEAVQAMGKKEWVGLTEEDIKDIEGWVEFKEAGSIDPVPLGKLVLYISHKLREKNGG